MRTYKGQKAGLTRAIRSQVRQQVIDECARTVKEWDSFGFWPDDWSRWQRALDDLPPVHDPYSPVALPRNPRLEDLA